MHLIRNMLISATLLAGFAVTSTGVPAWIFDNTKERIAANERATVLRNLHQLVPPETHDNDLFADMITVSHPALLGTDEPVQVWRARQKDTPVAAIINSIAPDGYSGQIKLLVAIHYDGRLAGVRVVQHRETPGLGDGIELDRSDWILGFNDKSLANTTADEWHVKRDGGSFDQLTGATITPRAVVKAVYNTLQYYQAKRQDLFSKPAQEATP